jgi:hypothetical protein
MARSNISIVQEAIAINGGIEVSVNGRTRLAKSVVVRDGVWVTDIPTADMCGFVRIRKTKDAVVCQARWIIEHAAEIRAAHEARMQSAAQLATNY